MMRNSEIGGADCQALKELKKLIAEGEGLHLEFKRKAAYPDKIVRELIAFANTQGGTLLIGVDDDKTLAGTKYPDEEAHVVHEALKNYCRPSLVYQEQIIPISDKRFVVRFDIPPSEKRPHFLVQDKNQRNCFVREADMSIKASAEMVEIIKRSKKNKSIQFTVGDAEKTLFTYLEEHHSITLKEYQQITQLNRFKARRKLILLVLANVIKIKATEKGDKYFRKT